VAEVPALPLAHSQVAAVVLAGGEGSRMGGVDKGLQLLHGVPLARRALQRLADQAGGAPGVVAVNANRNVDVYRTWDVPVWPDLDPGFGGPLAGFLSALSHVHALAGDITHVLVVPCDCPHFPLDLLKRLTAGLTRNATALALAVAADGESADASLRTQPVFCLMRLDVQDDLRAFLDSGRRRIDAWANPLHPVLVRFDAAGDAPDAFYNANTLAQLAQLERNAP